MALLTFVFLTPLFYTPVEEEESQVPFTDESAQYMVVGCKWDTSALNSHSGVALKGSVHGNSLDWQNGNIILGGSCVRRKQLSEV